MQSNHANRGLTRRDFLARGAAAAGALGLFTIVPRHVLGGPGYKAPSETLYIAGIGLGGKGHTDAQELKHEKIVALCDVDDDKGAATFNLFPEAKRFRDYRKMLEQEKGIDAIFVATPDHTHAVISMAALKMGKHVYCQKPLTHSIFEARELARAAREANVATQMGNQGLAEESVRVLGEMIADGCIGPVHEVHIWTDRPIWPQGIERPGDTPAVPASLDWDLWLGPAPARAFHPAYHPFSWRGWKDFGTGALGDIGCHTFAPVFRALKLGHPETVEGSASKYCPGAGGTPVLFKETYPQASTVKYQFPARDNMPACTLTWYDGGLKPPRPPELDEGRELGIGGTLFVGEKGKLLNGRLLPESRQKEYTLPAKTLPRSIGHYKEWTEACKGGKPGGSEFGFASLVTEVVLLGNIALETGKFLRWDGPNMRITNVPEANNLLRREYRPGWSL
jgi:hypothetical protein